MNMFKKNGGFTLVELIVVIAILAILAGVAVPAYTGYIAKAKDAAVLSELGAVLTAAQAANATNPDGVTSIEFKADSVKINETAIAETALEPFYTQASIDALQAKLADTTYAAGATWSAGTWSPVTAPAEGG